MKRMIVAVMMIVMAISATAAADERIIPLMANVQGVSYVGGYAVATRTISGMTHIDAAVTVMNETEHDMSIKTSGYIGRSVEEMHDHQMDVTDASLLSIPPGGIGVVELAGDLREREPEKTECLVIVTAEETDIRYTDAGIAIGTKTRQEGDETIIEYELPEGTDENQLYLLSIVCFGDDTPIWADAAIYSPQVHGKLTSRIKTSCIDLLQLNRRYGAFMYMLKK